MLNGRCAGAAPLAGYKLQSSAMQWCALQAHYAVQYSTANDAPLAGYKAALHCKTTA